MKTHLKQLIRTSLIGLGIAQLLAFNASAAKVIIPVSPVGQWDCVISGPGQNGIIFLNFTSDVDTNSGFPTFEGFFAQAGRRGPSPAVRGGTPDSGRGDSPSGSFTNIFGGGFIEGSAGGVADNGGASDWLFDSRGHRGNWFYNSKGQLVGSYFTTLNASATVTNYFESCYSTNFSIALTNGTSYPFSYNICATNAVLITNAFWGPASDGETGFTNLTFTNRNFTLGSIGVTNNVSFVGKVVLNKRLTLVGTSTFGKFTLTGVPLRPIVFPSGVPVDDVYFWTGMKTQNGIKLAEQFHLTATGIQNVYGMTGQGPSYSYGPTNSWCLISAKKQIGFVVSEVPYNSSPDKLHFSRASIGKLTNTKKAIGSKTIGDSVENINLIGFDAFVTPFLP